jgi:hypothetical protein
VTFFKKVILASFPLLQFGFVIFLAQEYQRKSCSKNVNEIDYRLNQTNAFASLLRNLWYSTLPCYDVIGISADKDGETAILKYCEWKGVQVPCKEYSKY